MPGRKRTHSEDWWANQRPEHVYRCSGRLRSDHSQCRREALPGLNVCDQHGGKTPVAVAAAFTRLGDSVEGAADVVAAIMNDPNVAARDRLAAAQHVMKLLGMEKERVEVRVSVDPIEELFRSLLDDPEGFLPADAEERHSKGMLSPEARAYAEDGYPEDIVDAVVVEQAEDLIGVRALPPAPKPKATTSSTVPPKHIRDDLERLGLL